MSEENAKPEVQEFVEVPSPDEVLNADLLNCQKLLKYCSPKIMDEAGISVQKRLAYLEAAVRIMRLQSGIAMALVREERLERTANRARARRPKFSPTREPEPTHYDYGQWLADHPEERDDAGDAREEKNLKTTAAERPRPMPRSFVG